MLKEVLMSLEKPWILRHSILVQSHCRTYQFYCLIAHVSKNYHKEKKTIKYKWILKMISRWIYTLVYSLSKRFHAKYINYFDIRVCNETAIRVLIQNKCNWQSHVPTIWNGHYEEGFFAVCFCKQLQKMSTCLLESFHSSYLRSFFHLSWPF